MKQCPKCGRYMTWYCKHWYGTLLTGWKCICGYDTTHNTSYIWRTYTILEVDNNGNVSRG